VEFIRSCNFLFIKVEVYHVAVNCIADYVCPSVALQFDVVPIIYLFH